MTNELGLILILMLVIIGLIGYILFTKNGN